MSEHEIDLSALSAEQQARWRSRLQMLPAGIRETMLKRLHRLPPGQVAQILRDNDAMLSKLEGKLGGVVEKAKSKTGGFTPTAPSEHHQFGSKSHYNGTIQRGDGHNFRLVPLIALAVVFALAVTWVLQQVSG